MAGNNRIAFPPLREIPGEEHRRPSNGNELRQAAKVRQLSAKLVCSLDFFCC
jgi:hypothetical protein